MHINDETQQEISPELADTVAQLEQLLDIDLEDSEKPLEVPNQKPSNQFPVFNIALVISCLLCAGAGAYVVTSMGQKNDYPTKPTTNQKIITNTEETSRLRPRIRVGRGGDSP